MQPEINLIIFDLGNVLVRFDETSHMAPLEGLVHDVEGKALDKEAIHNLISQREPDGTDLWSGLGHGTLETEYVMDILHNRVGRHIDKTLLKKCLCDIFTPLPERWNIFHSLIAQGKNVALLSDTCEQDIAQITSSMPNLLAPLPEDRRFYSYKIGAMKKHGAKAYRHVLDITKADPSKTLMIDDKLLNKKGADELGIHFAHVLPEQDLKKILKQDWDIDVPSRVTNTYPLNLGYKIMNGKPAYTKESAYRIKNSDKNFLAAPIILYRKNTQGVKEIALMIQDNAPMWRVFGNGFTPDPHRKKKDKMYFRNAVNILKAETNLPVKLREQIKPLFRFTGVNPDTREYKEGNRVFALDIGDFPLESKKCAFIEFFPLNQRPGNMIYCNDFIFDISSEILQTKPGKEKHFLCAYNRRRESLLDTMIVEGQEIIGLDKWRDCSAVVAKRNAGKLLRDPN